MKPKVRDWESGKPRAYAQKENLGKMTEEEIVIAITKANEEYRSFLRRQKRSVPTTKRTSS